MYSFSFVSLKIFSQTGAFLTWRDVTPSERQRVMFRYQHLIRANMDELAALITEEQGKTLVDAKGDVFRGLEVVEFACGAASHSECLNIFLFPFSYVV
jgi:malonate-semialdehyde dehydrogenase (acetylating)/methylmalonate-semialdehyde dehydrogenase